MSGQTFVRKLEHCTCSIFELAQGAPFARDCVCVAAVIHLHALFSSMHQQTQPTCENAFGFSPTG